VLLMTKRGGRIIRGTSDGDAYFIGRNDFAQHPDIPFEVKGLVFDILSRPQNWTVSIAGMLSINNTVGERKLHRIFRDAEDAGVIKGVRNRDEHGKLGAVDYYVSDNPERVDEAILEDIRRTAEELAEMTGKSLAPARSEPHRQNSSVDEHEPHCCFPRVGFGPPKKERSKKEKKEEVGRFSKNENSPRPRQPQLLDLPKTASSRNGVADAEVHEGWAVLKAAFRTLGAGCNRNDQRDRLMRDIIRSEGLDALREIGEAIKTQLFLRGAGKQGWKLKPNQVLESAELRARIRDGNYVDVWMHAGANAQMRGRPGR
jgi:hypothetical protein